MENSKFNPEEDFEEENLHIINSLRKINDAKLPESFDTLLINDIKKRNNDRKVFRVFSRKFSIIKNHKLAYSLGFVIFITTFLYFLYPSRMKENKTMGLKSIESVGKDTSKLLEKIPSKLGNKLAKKNQNEIFDLVTRNLPYGFLYEISPKDIQKQLVSAEFKKTMMEFEKPSIDDTVRTIIKLLENQEN